MRLEGGAPFDALGFITSVDRTADDGSILAIISRPRIADFGSFFLIMFRTFLGIFLVFLYPAVGGLGGVATCATAPNCDGISSEAILLTSLTCAVETRFGDGPEP